MVTSTAPSYPDAWVLQGVAKWRTIDSQRAKLGTAAIAGILGGRKVLGKAVRRPDDLAKLVRNGLPTGSVTSLAQKLHLGE
jgi:hypothetical protein